MNCSFQSRADAQSIKRELAADVLRCSGTLSLEATGRSMLPTIWPGDTLVVEATPSGRVEPGDIVLFSNCGRFVAHRIIDRTGSLKNAQVLTRGDSLADADAPIHESEIMGRVSFILRSGRCFKPGKELHRSERAVSAILSRSEIASRVLVGLHGIAEGVFRRN